MLCGWAIVGSRVVVEFSGSEDDGWIRMAAAWDARSCNIKRNAVVDRKSFCFILDLLFERRLQDFQSSWVP